MVGIAIAAKLRAVGVIILGRYNLSEEAIFRSFSSSKGWRVYGDQVTSAYYPEVDPSGNPTIQRKLYWEFN